MHLSLIVLVAMMVEPIETESKAALNHSIMALLSLAERTKAGDEALRRALSC